MKAKLEISTMPKKSPGLLSTMINTIIYPLKAMSWIIEKPRAIGMILINMLSYTLVYILRWDLLIEYCSLGIPNTAAYSGSELGIMQSALAVTTIISTFFMPLVLCLIFCLVFFTVFKILDKEVRFKTTFSIVAFSYAVNTVGALFCLIASFYTNSIILNTSLAVFLSDIKGTYFYGICRGCDIFLIWQFIIMYIGFSKMTTISKTKIIIVEFIVFLGYLLTMASTFMNS